MASDSSTLRGRSNKYGNTGHGYENVTYGANHLRLYCETRNEEIGKILATHDTGDTGLRILEVGCGTGLVLNYLSSLGDDNEIVGVDACEVMLEQARDRFTTSTNAPRLELASCDELPFPDGYFDVVVATRFIHLFSHDEKKEIYGEFRRVLQPNGISIVEFYSRPFAWVRYYLARQKQEESPDKFFSHYPTSSEVRDIIGGPFKKHSVRIAGSRILMRIMGKKLLGRFVRTAASIPVLNRLVDEYLVVTRK